MCFNLLDSLLQIETDLRDSTYSQIMGKMQNHKGSLSRYSLYGMHCGLTASLRNFKSEKLDGFLNCFLIFTS